MAAEVLQQLPQLEALCERLYNSQAWQLFVSRSGEEHSGTSVPLMHDATLHGLSCDDSLKGRMRCDGLCDF